MSNKYRRKLSVIGLVLTLCLAVIGVGYGGWYQNLYIRGTTNTGEVDIEFVADSVNVTDNETPWVPGGPPDVGSTNVSLLDTDSDGDKDNMSVSLNHTYSSYEGKVRFRVRNNGTVPIKIVSVNITAPQTGEVEVSLSGVPTDGSFWLNPGQSSGVLTLRPHVTTNVKGNYNFSVAIKVANWNEEG